MAAPPPNPELSCHSACLSQLLFHLHSGVGTAEPDTALADLLAALPTLAPEHRRAIANTFSALQSRPDGLGPFHANSAPSEAPGHPDLLPLVPVEPHAVPLASSPPLLASLSPFLLHDTFIFELSFELSFELCAAGSGQPHALASEPFALLRQASLGVEPSFAPSLGQCWLLYLQTHDSSLAFAQACAAAVGPPELRLCGEATLLGRPIWEFAAGRHSWYIWLDDPENPIHQQEDGSYQQHLLNLLCCRAKMEFAARAGRHAFEEGLSHYQAIEACSSQLATFENGTAPTPNRSLSSLPAVKDPSPSLRTLSTQPIPSTEDAQQLRRIANLEALLTALPQHGLRLARCERDITTHRLTISTNTFNAAQAAQALWREGDTFLKGFLEQEGSTWIQQLDHDGQVLRSGQRYAEQLIDSLRAIVALDGQKLQMKLERQEKMHERTLQLTIFFVGAALSISGLAAATRPRPTTKLLATLFLHQPQLPAAWLWLGDIAIHFLIGLTAALLVLLLWGAWCQLRGRAWGQSRQSDQP
jgi:hypothetical protein